MKRRERTLYCSKCLYTKREVFMPPVDDVDCTCPECGNHQMYFKMHLQCVEDSCKRFTVVEGDPNMHNPNFHNKKYDTFDIRNFGFVCPEHQQSYEWHCKHKKGKFDLKKGHAYI